MKVRMIPTPESSQISQFGYDVTTQTLVVEFENGGTYGYDRVPLATFLAMYEAPSVGKYFSSMVKGSFTHQRIYMAPVKDQAEAEVTH